MGKKFRKKLKFKPRIKEVEFIRGRIYTHNLIKGNRVYGEKLIENGRLREWVPSRSKIGAAIMKGIKNLGIKKGSKVLYLGAASGTTASHVSDIVGKEGAVFCIDIAYRVVRDLVLVCEKRKNMFPLLADASHPETYKAFFPIVDVVYEDVASKNQAEILIRNCDLFLKPNGWAIIAVKARSIDVTKKPQQVFNEIEKKFKKHFTIIEKTKLEPFEKDHMFYVMKKIN